LLGEVGVTATLTVGLYLAVNGAAGGVVAAVYDRLVARAGRTRLITAAGALWVIGFGSATVVTSPLAAAAPVVFVGFGIGLVFPSAFAWIEALAPPDRQGSLSSYVASAGYLGQFCSPLAFGLAVPLGGVRAVFAAAAAVAALTLGGVLLAGRRGANGSI
jgi:MFS family permease